MFDTNGRVICSDCKRPMAIRGAPYPDKPDLVITCYCEPCDRAVVFHLPKASSISRREF